MREAGAATEEQLERMREAARRVNESLCVVLDTEEAQYVYRHIALPLTGATPAEIDPLLAGRVLRALESARATSEYRSRQRRQEEKHA